MNDFEDNNDNLINFDTYELPDKYNLEKIESRKNKLKKLEAVDPEEITQGDTINLAFDNILLISTMTMKHGAGLVHKGLKELQIKLEKKEV